MHNKILCIGEILWDCFPKGKFLGGAPFNAACHLHMLGEDVNFVSRIGKDILGKEAAERMTEQGLDISYIQEDKSFSTGIVKVNIGDDGIPSYEIEEPAAWDFIELNENALRLAKESDILVFGSLAQRNLKSRETIAHLREIIPVKVFDVNIRPPYDNKDIILESFQDTQILKLNNFELQKLIEWMDLPNKEEEAVKQLAFRFHFETVCITRGSSGAALLHKNKWTEHTGYKIDVKDTVGAGDAFLAAMLSAILKGKENHEILAFSNAVGAFVASKDGAVPPLDLPGISKLNMTHHEK